MTKSCFLCDEPITKSTDSSEHIICNAVGGRRKTRGFLCRCCNSSTGEHWDAELAKQLNILCLFFDIDRERGTPPSQQVQTVAGQKLLMRAGGQLTMAAPTLKRAKTDAGTQVQISARSMKEARQTLEGLKRKNPELNVEEVLGTVQSSFVAPDAPVTFSLNFGGEESGRAIVKAAAAFAHSCGLDAQTFSTAKAYLRGSKDEACFGYYHEKDLVSDRPVGMPFHCVAVSGDPQTKLLLGYVEYFGFQRMVICLSDQYSGPVINRSYAIDPIEGKEISLTIEMPFTSEDIRDIYNYGRVPSDSMIAALKAIMPTALKRQEDAEQKRILSEAMDYGFANCGAKIGEILTKEQAGKMAMLVAEKMTPLILRKISQGRMRFPDRSVLPPFSRSNPR